MWSTPFCYTPVCVTLLTADDEAPRCVPVEVVAPVSIVVVVTSEVLGVADVTLAPSVVADVVRRVDQVAVMV